MFIVEALLSILLILVLIRISIGPTVWDRLAAYSSSTTKGIILLATISFLKQDTTFFNVEITLALLALASVAVITHFLEENNR